MSTKRSTLRRTFRRPPIGHSHGNRFLLQDNDSVSDVELDDKAKIYHDSDVTVGEYDQLNDTTLHRHGDETFGDILTHPVQEFHAHQQRKAAQEEQTEHNRDSGVMDVVDYKVVIHFRQLCSNQHFALDHHTANDIARKLRLSFHEKIRFNGVYDTNGLTEFLRKTKRDFSIKIHHKAEGATTGSGTAGYESTTRSEVHDSAHRFSISNPIIELNEVVFLEFRLKQHLHPSHSSTSRRPFFQHPDPDLSADVGEEQAASWLELFYDLFFVATLTEFTHSHMIKDWNSLWIYTSWFIIAWWAWISSSLYSSRFDTDDVVHHIWKLIEMCGVIAMAGSAEYFLTSPGYVYGYIALKAVLVIEYGVVLIVAIITRSKSRTPLMFYVGANIVSIILWASSMPLMYLPHNEHLVLRYLGVLIEILVNVIVRRNKALTWAASHLAERIGLLTLIVLGENLIGLVSLVSSAGTNILIVLPNFMSVVIIFGFFFMYFEDFNKEVFLHNKYHQIWVYLHFPLHLCQVAFGIALIDSLRLYKQQMVDSGRVQDDSSSTHTTPTGTTENPTTDNSGTSSSEQSSTTAQGSESHAAKRAVDSFLETQSNHDPILRSVDPISFDTNHQPSIQTEETGAGYLSLGKYAISSAALAAMQSMNQPDLLPSSESMHDGNSVHHLVRRSVTEVSSDLTDEEKVFIYKSFLIAGGLILVFNSLIKLLNTKISDIYGKIIIGSRVVNAIALWCMCALSFASLDAIVLISVMMGSLILQAVVDLLD